MKRIIYFLLVIGVFQMGSFHVIGKRMLPRSLSFSYMDFVREKPDTVLLIYCNCGEKIEPLERYDNTYNIHNINYEEVPALSLEDKLRLESKLKMDFETVVFIKRKHEIEIHSKKWVASFYLCADPTPYFVGYIDESILIRERNHSSFIGSDWQSRYVWILVGWFKVDTISLGIS